MYQDGSASSSRRWISSELGTSPVVLPPPVMPPVRPVSSPPPVQQNRMPPSTQVVIREPFLPRLFSSARTTSPAAISSDTTAVMMLNAYAMSPAPSAEVPAYASVRTSRILPTTVSATIRFSTWIAATRMSSQLESVTTPGRVRGGVPGASTMILPSWIRCPP